MGGGSHDIWPEIVYRSARSSMNSTLFAKQIVVKRCPHHPLRTKIIRDNSEKEKEKIRKEKKKSAVSSPMRFDLLDKGTNVLLHHIRMPQAHFLVKGFPSLINVLLKGLLCQLCRVCSLVLALTE